MAAPHIYITTYIQMYMSSNEQEREYEEGVAGTDVKRKEFESKDEAAKKYKKELNTDLEADEGKRSRDKEINR